MKTLRQTLSDNLTAAFKAAGFDVEATVLPSDRPDLADFQCNTALGLAKSAGMPPRDIAMKVLAQLPEIDCPAVGTASVEGPGFINLRVEAAFLAEHAENVSNHPQLGTPIEPRKKILIDYGGFNIAKPLHVGHLRASVVGDSLRRMNVFLGHDVTGDVHLGDWGTQMGMVIEGIRREQPNLPYFDETYTGVYPDASPVTVEELERIYPAQSALCKEDPAELEKAKLATKKLQDNVRGYRALWQKFVDVSIEAAKRDMDLLGVHFDWWYGEAHYHDRIAGMIDRLKQAGQAVESEGAVIVPLQSEKELPPLLLEKSDGAFLYSTTDLAAIDERVSDDHFDSIQYEADVRQSLHFEQVFLAAKQTGIAKPETELKFFGHGTINGSDGKPFKSRTGGVMKLHDLIELSIEKAREQMDKADIAADYSEEERADITHKVGIAALKYADLKNARQSDYTFDTDKFTSFEGKTGPYLLYTAVRIRSIFRKMGLSELEYRKDFRMGSFERDVAFALCDTPERIMKSITLGEPHHLCEGLFLIAQAYNSFYQACNISKQKNEAVRDSWLALSAHTLNQLETGLGLLGISVPERM